MTAPYINPACQYGKAHGVCSGVVWDGKTPITCHCDCHKASESHFDACESFTSETGYEGCICSYIEHLYLQTAQAGE